MPVDHSHTNGTHPNGVPPVNGTGEGSANGHGVSRSTPRVKEGLAQMLKGGVIMDVMNPEQAKIAEEAGACAVSSGEGGTE